MATRCSAFTKDKKRCKGKCTRHSKYCAIHKEYDSKKGDCTSCDSDMDGEQNSIQANMTNEYNALIQENKNLKLTIKQLADEIASLQIVKIRKYAPSTLSITNKAKWMFYQAWKTNPEFLAELRKRLHMSGILDDPEHAVIDWRVVKYMLDKVFDHQLAPDKKEPFIDAAKAELFVRYENRRK